MIIKSIYVQPIIALSSRLEEAEIPHTTNSLYDGYQIRFPWCKGDIICHSGSYGSSAGHVESYCFPWDEGDVTELTISEAFHNIVDYYNKKADQFRL